MNNKFKISILFVAIICLFTSSVFSQFSRDDATSLVLNTILAGDIGKVDVYSTIGTKSGNVELIDNETIGNPYAGSWVFFVDDKPYSGWFHDCRYIFVDGQTGGYSIVEGNIFPKNQSTAFELIGEADSSEPADLVDGTGATEDGLPPNDHYFAVILGVGNNYGTEPHWYDVSLVYNTLIDVYGYKKENIFVHYGPYGTSPLYGDDLDGEPYSDDIDYSAFGTEIHATFNELAGITTLNDDIPELDVDDQLAFFVVDAPSIDVGPGATAWLFWNDIGGGPYLDMEGPSELAQIVDQINCAQMTMTFSFNYAGGVVSDFMDLGGQAACGSRYVHDCSFYEEKHYEQYITGGNYGEYLYYWAAAARGHYPNSDQPWITSTMTGTFPFTAISGFGDHPDDYHPDIDGDGYVQMEEAFAYANAMDTWSDDGFYYNPWTVGEDEVPGQHDNVPFLDDVMTLAGYAGLIETPVTVQGNFIIGGTLTTGEFGYGEELAFDDGSNIYLVNHKSKIIVNENSEVQLNSNVTIKGVANSNVINVYGKLYTPGLNNTFAGLDGGWWKGIEIHNPISSIDLNESTFEDCGIYGEAGILEISNSSFENSFINISTSYVSLYINEFQETTLKMTSTYPSNDYLFMWNNTFNGLGMSGSAITVNSFGDFNIKRSTISNYGNGIVLFYCGSGSGSHILDGCHISNCTSSGVEIYNSTATVYSNSLTHNGSGIKLFNKCNIELIGWEDAWYVGETQSISNNEYHEVYASKNSFPHTFRWNVIRDEDNTEPMVYYKQDLGGIEPALDVRNNYWGDNFDPKEDLFPESLYEYDPIWEIPLPNNIDDLAEASYKSALAQKTDSNYVVAKESFKQTIGDYPSSKYAKASMKELFTLEEFVSNDYHSLKDYFDTDATIQNNDGLEKLSGHLSNNCEIKLENWPIAIDWFEVIIQGPESLEDSIFAIIDLGHTYNLMEQGGYKSSYKGAMIEHIPVSLEQFEEKRDFLLSLLPGEQLSETMKDGINKLSGGELLQNVPNPFKGSTQIWFKLENESNVQLNIYNSTGQLVKSFVEGKKTVGSHCVDFNASGLINGLYFYSININGKISDSKKMTIMK